VPVAVVAGAAGERQAIAVIQTEKIAVWGTPAPELRAAKRMRAQYAGTARQIGEAYAAAVGEDPGGIEQTRSQQGTGRGLALVHAEFGPAHEVGVGVAGAVVQVQWELVPVQLVLPCTINGQWPDTRKQDSVNARTRIKKTLSS
jgi:hypothetical protein